MTLSALIKRGGLRTVASATSATVATDEEKKAGTVASVADVAVANYRSPETDYRSKNTDTTPETFTTDDPLVSVEQWYPEFHRLHAQVITEAPDVDYGWLRQTRPALYRQIKDKEAEIDALQAARLTEVMDIMREWRRLIIEAEFERRRDTKH